MALQYHPKQGTIVLVNFDKGFQKPEMVKKRPCVVVSPPIAARHGLCTVVPLSTSTPMTAQKYHYKFQIPFQLPPKWSNDSIWLKGDMICAVGLHRVDFLSLGKDRFGKRQYQKQTLSRLHLHEINNCILHSLGIQPMPPLPPLTG